MVLKSICGTNVTCLVLNTNKPLFSFDDSVKLIFNKALWSSEVKRRQKYSYANLLHNFSSFLKIYIYDNNDIIMIKSSRWYHMFSTWNYLNVNVPTS